ncbi:MAG: FAD-dependent oxidoreductase, partial [Myxococcota bacterium]
WDVGVHAVGEVTTKSMTGRLLAQLTRNKLQWASLGEVYDEFHFPDGFHIDFPDNPEQFRDNLYEAFPEDRDAIDAYLAKVKEVAGAMKPYYLARTLPPQVAGRPITALSDKLLARKAQRFLEQKTAAVLDEITDNQKLRTVLTSQFGYYGSTPSRSSFAIQALVTKHFMWGGYYPVGGSKEIARHLLQTVADGGGWTRIKADVEEIVVEEGTATGVRLKNGELIRAGKVISAAGIGATVNRMLAPEYRGDWAEEVTQLPPAPAHVCLYLGFEGDIRRAGASAANKWFYETWSCEDDYWEVRPDQDEQPEAPVLYCSFPSLKDPAHDPGEKIRHTGEVVTFAPWESFQMWQSEPWKKRGDAYAAWKEKLKDQLLAQFFRHMPELKEMTVYVEMSTPVSTDTFVRPQRGSIYGLEPTPERFACPWLRPRSPVDGLLFAGSEVATVGVIGARMGGVLAALWAERGALFRYLNPFF